MIPGGRWTPRRAATKSVRRSLGAIAVAAVLAVVAAGCTADVSVPIDVPAQADGALPDDVQTQLESALADAMTATGSAGAIVGVWAPWSGSWVAGVGTQGPGGAAVDADATFPVGTMTRSMTCDVMYALADAGELDVDDTIATWVSGVPDETTVTLGQLCTGTSGLGSYRPQLFPMWVTNPTRIWNVRELASYGLGQPRVGEPGTVWSDSDTAYALLGLALERAGGARMADLYARYVFDPLDLASASYSTGKAPAKGVLSGFQALPGEGGALNCAAPADLTTLSPSTGNTGSAVRADIRDLGRYAQALASSALPATPESRFDGVVTMDPNNPTWLTTAGGAVQAGSMIGQYGNAPGYLTAAFSDPGSGLTVAVVLNDSAGGRDLVAYLAWELAAIASKAAPAAGETAPDAGLPWTAQQFHDAIAAAPVCPAA